jgi:putative selenate reductase
VQCSTFCDKCVEVCPNRANYTYHISPVRLMVPQLSSQDGSLAVSGYETFEVRQERQIIHVDDFCNECGNCATFCVHQGKPYTEKPRLFLRESDFVLEEDNAFYIEGAGAERAPSIRRREGGAESRLSRDFEGFTFENAQLRVRLHPKDGTLASGFDIQEMTLTESFPGTFSLAEAAEMALILEGLSTTLAAVLAGT